MPKKRISPPHPYCTYIQSFGSVLNHLLAQPSVEDVTVEPTVEAVAVVTMQRVILEPLDDTSSEGSSLGVFQQCHVFGTEQSGVPLPFFQGEGNMPHLIGKSGHERSDGAPRAAGARSGFSSD